MAEEAATTSAETQDATTEATQDTTTAATQGQTYTQEQVNAMLADHKKRIQGQFADYDDLKTKLAESESTLEASKADLDKVTGERDTFKGQLDGAELESVKLRVMIEKSVPVELVDRLKGSTKEELEADADVLKAALKPSGGSFDGGARTTPAAVDIATESDPTKILEWAKTLR